MGKVVKAVAFVALAVAIAVAAPYLGAAFLSLIGTATATALATSVATAVAGALLAGVAGFAMRALAGKPSPLSPTPINFRQSISNSFIIIGKRRQGGLMVFRHGNVQGSDHYRYFVLACAGHRCKGVTKWYLSDEEVSVNGSGLVTSGKYANAAWLWFARGTADQAANTTFVSECNGKWTTNHRGRGVAVIYAKFKMTEAVVEAGMPTISAEIEGADEIRDPRDDTEKYTNLAIPAFYWWMQMPREEGGFGAYADEIPDDVTLSAWTNICDEDVALAAGGTEKRYALDAVIETGAAPSQLRGSFLTCMAGTYSYASGKHLMRPGYWTAPSATLEEDDLEGSIGIPVLGDPQAIATEVSGSFFNPAALYQPQPVPTRIVVSADPRQVDIDLPFITSHTRGQRILEIHLRRAQAEKRVNWPMNIAGIALTTMQTVQLNTARYGLSNYAFVIDKWSLTSGYGVALQLREENADIYDWSTSDELPLASGGTLAVPDPVPGTPGEAANVGAYDEAALVDLEARIAALEP